MATEIQNNTQDTRVQYNHPYDRTRSYGVISPSRVAVLYEILHQFCPHLIPHDCWFIKKGFGEDKAHLEALMEEEDLHQQRTPEETTYKKASNPSRHMSFPSSSTSSIYWCHTTIVATPPEREGRDKKKDERKHQLRPVL